MSKREKVKLGDIGTIITGNTPSTNNNLYYSSNDIPFYKPNDIDIETVTELGNSTVYISELARDKSRILPANSVLVTCIGTIGKVGVTTKECSCNQQINAIIPNEKLCLSKYLAYVIKSKKDYLESIANAPVVPIINKTQFSKFEILILPIDDQKKIVKTLDAVSEIIKKRKQQLEKFDKLVKSRFIEMFGDYKQYKNLENYAALITKGASPKWQGVEYTDEGILFVTSENVREGYVDLSRQKFLDRRINDIQPRSILHQNDVLINIVGASIGRAAIYESDKIANINQAVALVRIDESALNLRFLIVYLNSTQVMEAYKKMKKGGARDNLSLKNIDDLMIPVVPITLQNQFGSFVEQVDKSKLAVKQSIYKLELLKNALMQQYFD